MTANKIRGTPIRREKIFLNKNNTRPNSARKIKTKRRRSVTWAKFHTEQNLLIVKSMVRKGWTNDEIADYIGITQSTFYEWQKKHPEFSEVLKEPKEYCVAKVENAVFARATGIEKTIHEKETVTVEKDGKKTVTTTEKDGICYYPPDTRAAIFYLTNRAGKDWKQKQQTEITGRMSIDAAVNIEGRLKAALERKEKE